jgi:hypothetical protein
VDRLESGEVARPSSMMAVASTSTSTSAQVPDYNKPPPYAIVDNEHDNQQQQPFRVRLAHSPEPAASSTVAAPRVDRSKKPAPTTTAQPPRVKPVPPPKPKVNPRGSMRREQPTDDNGGYYLNLPMNSKIVQQQQNGSFGTSAPSAFELYRRPTAAAAPPAVVNATPAANVNGNYEHQPLLQENTTSGTFDWRGGVLVQRNVNGGQVPIEVRIPEGAIPEGVAQTIWFHAVPLPRDNNHQQDVVNG